MHYCIAVFWYSCIFARILVPLEAHALDSSNAAVAFLHGVAVQGALVLRPIAKNTLTGLDGLRSGALGLVLHRE